jgi:hypothetical protein
MKSISPIEFGSEVARPRWVSHDSVQVDDAVGFMFYETVELGQATGVGSPLKCATFQSEQTKNPSKDKDEVEDEVGLDASHHTRIFLRGGENLFFLISSFIG